MMKINKILLGVAFSSAILSSTQAMAQDVSIGNMLNQEQINKKELDFLQSVIPNTKISKYSKSIIDGFYSTYLDNGQIIYVNPFKDIVFFGEMMDKNGFNFTDNDRHAWQEELLQKEIKNTPSDLLIKQAKKLTYGKGSKNGLSFVIFTDPECPYCKVTEEFFSKKDVTLYVNLFPIRMVKDGKMQYLHPSAHDEALQILSSKDFQKTFDDIRTGKKVHVEISKNAEAELDGIYKLAEKMQVRGTPRVYVIDEKNQKIVDIINGANTQKFEQYLEQK